MLKYNMYYFLTFRTQIEDQQLFEDFMDYYPPLLEEYNSYIWVVEEDETLRKHFHAVIELPETKSKKTYKDKFNNKNLRKFKDMALSNTNTTDDGFNTRQVEKDSEEDLLNVVGYTQKESNPKRIKSKGFPKEYLEKAYYFYKSKKRVDKEQVKNDTIILTTKNAHIHIKTYMKKRGIVMPPLNSFHPTSHYADIELDMRMDGYSFVNLNGKQKRIIFQDLQLQNITPEEKQKGHYKWMIEEASTDMINEGDMSYHPDHIATHLTLMRLNEMLAVHKLQFIEGKLIDYK